MKYTLIFLLSFSLASCGSTRKSAPVQPPGSGEPNEAYILKFHEGIRLKQQGQINQAILAFEACVGMKPQDDASHYALSQLYLASGQMSKSGEAIRKALDIDPKNNWYVQEYAFMVLEAGNYKEAIKYFKLLQQREPEQVEWLFSLGEAQMRSGDLKGSLTTLDQLELLLGKSPQMSLQKFKMYSQIGQAQAGIEELKKGLEAFPDDPELLANLVDYYFAQRQDDQAFAYLQRLSEADPQNGNAHMALAQYYDHKGNKKDSYSELKKAFACADLSLDLKVKVILSMFDSQFKLDPDMFELADILVAQYPDDGRPYTVRGDFHMKSENRTAALADFTKALQYEKGKYAIWEQVMIMEYEKQDYPALYEHSKTCLEYFPAISKVYLLNGIAAIQLKKYAEAVDQLTIGHELVINDPVMKAEFYSQKAEAYFSLNKVKEGQEFYEKALKADQLNLLIKNNYAWRLALLSLELQKAESLIKQVLMESPNQAHFIDTYGWVLFQQGKYAEALEQFKAAMSINGSDKIITEHLGDALFKTGKTNEAVTEWKKARELGSANQKINDKIEKKTYYDPVF